MVSPPRRGGASGAGGGGEVGEENGGRAAMASVCVLVDYDANTCCVPLDPRRTHQIDPSLFVISNV
jgi:hypothetical protein